jgi:hypothetical protein
MEIQMVLTLERDGASIYFTHAELAKLRDSLHSHSDDRDADQARVFSDFLTFLEAAG